MATRRLRPNPSNANQIKHDAVRRSEVKRVKGHLAAEPVGEDVTNGMGANVKNIGDINPLSSAQTGALRRESLSPTSGHSLRPIQAP